jgi:mono/diheme cytochrome c family protein
MGISIRLVRVTVAATLLLAAAETLSAQTQTSSDTGRSVLSGVYTTEQAARGETTFKGVCASCHAEAQFTGATFQKAWSNRPVFAFFDQIKTAMPQDNPGGLSRAEYLAVITYILKLNSYPTGAAELPDDDVALRLIRFAPVSGSNDR